MKNNHTGRSDLSVKMRIYKPRLHPEERHDRTPALTYPHLHALLHHKEKTHTPGQLAQHLNNIIVIEDQQEEEGPEWWAMK